MDNQQLIDQAIRTFKEESGIDDTPNNTVAFMHLADELNELITSAENAIMDYSSTCNCSCDICEECTE